MVLDTHQKNIIFIIQLKEKTEKNNKTSLKTNQFFSRLASLVFCFHIEYSIFNYIPPTEQAKINPSPNKNINYESVFGLLKKSGKKILLSAFVALNEFYLSILLFCGFSG